LKKPYNPVIGEVYRCFFHHTKTDSKTFYLAEQVIFLFFFVFVHWFNKNKTREREREIDRYKKRTFVGHIHKNVILIRIVDSFR
jgi:hypothetical protein